jgi:hypothetical protein
MKDVNELTGGLYDEQTLQRYFAMKDMQGLQMQRLHNTRLAWKESFGT